jgi:hypothetical protein
MIAHDHSRPLMITLDHSRSPMITLDRSIVMMIVIDDRRSRSRAVSKGRTRSAWAARPSRPKSTCFRMFRFPQIVAACGVERTILQRRAVEYNASKFTSSSAAGSVGLASLWTNASNRCIATRDETMLPNHSTRSYRAAVLHSSIHFGQGKPPRVTRQDRSVERCFSRCFRARERRPSECDLRVILLGSERSGACADITPLHPFPVP